MSDEERVKLISKKATYYKYQQVHVTFKDGTWENGWIEDVKADFFMLRLTDEGELKNKKSEMPVFFMVVEDIEEYIGGRRG